MFEIFFVIGILAWLMDLLVEYLAVLPVFPTLLVAFFTIPALIVFDYHLALTRQFLGGVEKDRHPVPPEMFRWRLVRPRWRRQIIVAAWLVPCGWLPIFWYPAEMNFSSSSLVGWFCGLLAIFSSSLLCSRLGLYFRVAQWFDEMTPRIAGWFWKMMYRISDNPDYLPVKNEPEESKLEKNLR